MQISPPPHGGSGSAAPRPTLTVAVLTLNEGHRIAACLESAAFADQIVVVDSGSTDDTVEEARRLGAEVHVHPDWQGFAVQRNRLLSYATGDYIFFLDADEVMTPAFREELQAIVASGARAVWKIRWRMVAFGHPLRHLRTTSAIERLFRRDMLREYIGVVHEEAVLTEPQAPRHEVRAPLLHHSRETVRGSLEKLTQYAMLGAAKRAALGKRGGVLRGLASGSSMFVRLYVLRLGFLCGGAGFLYCLFVALEAFFRYAALEYDRDQLSGSVRR
ncbi:glycosyltransferase family 2 protein [Acidovorax sp. GBBC 3334]|uniref:glycosyltransferase family 2 protein n=1 Tax=unclassified Acidovorax TaxID=2684926 RepID=UPI00230287EB|nr:MULTISPECIES: glycosyltransferase family 2 protein [unclassified Acidovorax]MDA8455877.1 glycosyltransferase family 2 protein [Acidovorax sp. GBBC 3334]MDA8523060.1 glycosyltransferase family 2 protein [Acidovorax sp. NCPPB 4044]